MNSPLPTSSIDLVFAARMNVLRRNLPFSLLGVLLTSGLMIGALYGVVAGSHLMLWGGANAVLTAARGWAAWRFWPDGDDLGGLRRWHRLTFLGTALGGMLWGLPVACWVLQVPLAHQMFLLIALLTMGTGAIYAYCIDLPVLYGFQIPYFVPPTLAMGLVANPLLQVMCLAGILYLFVTLAFAHRMFRTQVVSLRLRFENLDLLKRVQEEKEAAVRSDLAKSRFLAAASHDLRQPMHALSLFIGALRRHALPEDSRHLVDNISRAASSMGALFEGLLNLSRLDAGVVVPRLQPVALDVLLEQLVLEFRPQAQTHGLALRARPSSAIVRSDPALLGRILRNLLDNAIRHTRHGGVLIGVRSASATAVRVEVWDTGPGIPMEEHERVFWEFHQLGNPERDRSKGLGLGLAIVRRTAALLAHPLELRSRVGRGTVFGLTLARAQLQLAPDAEAAPATPADPSSPSALVFVIEDDAPSRLGLQLLLEDWGHQVVAAAGVDELIERAAGVPGKPRLIVSDYRLREHQTGIEAIERVREEYNDDSIAALLVSGDTDPQRLIEVAQRGLPLLHKPVDPAHLQATIARLLAAAA
jgi:signal transduction histidine kinase/CheY-like chemotaxis protein